MNRTALSAPLLLAVAALTFGCGDDATHGAGHVAADASPDVERDAPATTDAESDASADLATTPDVSPDAMAPAPDGPPVAPMLNDCVAMSYVDRSDPAAERVIRPRGTTGYTPRCVIIRAGQSVTFEMDFAAHPLVPGVPHGPTAGATTPNVIPRTVRGASVEVAFPSAGNFPFYCNTHGHVGMAGVVRVVQ